LRNKNYVSNPSRGSPESRYNGRKKAREIMKTCKKNEVLPKEGVDRYGEGNGIELYCSLTE
jgi:hypothetical protein